MLYEDLVAGFRWRIPEEFNFASDVVDAWAEDRGRVALWWEDENGREARYTFWDFRERSGRLAAGLASHGIGRGDPVLLSLPAIPEWYVAFLGALRLGAIVVSCEAGLPAAEIHRRLRQTGAKAIVTTADRASELESMELDGASLRLRVAAGSAPAGWRGLDEVASRALRAPERVRTRSEEPAVCLYTSGRSGPPKPVLHTHGYTLAQRAAAEHWLDLRRTDLHWANLETGGAAAACAGFFGPWSLGAAVFLHQGPADPRRQLELLEGRPVTTFCTSPAEYDRLSAEQPSPGRLASLRHCTSLGGPLAPATMLSWRDRLGVVIHEGYGQAEIALPIANLKGLPVRPGSMGKPCPGHDVRVVGANGAERAPGEAGDLVVVGRPPSLFREYWREPSPTTAGTRDESHRTGDRAVRDQQGYFWFIGRTED